MTDWSLFSRIVLVMSHIFSIAVAVQEHKLGLLIPYTDVAPVGILTYNLGERFASAMTIAIDRINADPNLLPGVNLTFTWNNTDCNEFKVLQSQFQQVNDGVKAFIGPGCFCNTAARNAGAYNKSMISYVSILCDLIWLDHFNRVLFSSHQFQYHCCMHCISRSWEKWISWETTQQTSCLALLYVFLFWLNIIYGYPLGEQFFPFKSTWNWRIYFSSVFIIWDEIRYTFRGSKTETVTLTSDLKSIPVCS